MQHVSIDTLPVPASASSLTGQRVLIAHFDIFRNVGGGQSVYQAIIARRPGDTFYYFVNHEQVDAPRPANTVAVPFIIEMSGSTDPLSADIAHFFSVYVDCRNMAASVARACPGTSFDVLDVPDFAQYGLFLAQAMALEGIAVGSTVVALHGTLSSAFHGGWPAHASQAQGLAELRMREQLQFRTADARYAISDSYAQEWRNVVPLPVNRLDPLCVIRGTVPVLPPASALPPDLAFVGRREKWKGPDLFVDLAWCVDPALYGQLILAGPDGPNQYGLGSTDFIAGMSHLRGIAPLVTGSLNRMDMQALYSRRTLMLMPSRHDTFNLTVLEAVLEGCPVLVSRRAGVAEWLQEALPGLPWMIVDIDCSRSAAAAAADTLRDYDGRRAALVEALQRRDLQPDARTLDGIYTRAEKHDIEARQSVVELAARFAMQVRGAETSALTSALLRARRPARAFADRLAPMLPDPVWRQLESLVGTGKSLYLMRRRGRPHWQAMELLRSRIKQRTGLSPRTLKQIATVRHSEKARSWMLTSTDRNYADRAAKLASLSHRVPDHLVNRVPLFSEMARLERLNGNDLTSATYGLRLMRWLGRDAYGTLPFVAATLRANGFQREAETAEAMFGPADQAVSRCAELVNAAYLRNKEKPDLPLAVVDDRRGARPRRVAVIASLYNAADKLPTLLRMLSQQSVAVRDELEVVLVDSNSPSDEHGALKAFLAEQDLPVVYARSAVRETIQAAWNRGIKLSRAPYLAFLGADEGLHPDALNQLAACLDADPGVDWAMADSIVTSVDADGVYDSDVMPYNRSGFSQDLVYLETCYLSWVGGLYRRTVHERFGYYDESFRAAGDTEFKNRVMPHIRSAYVPRMLGVFNNYPEERTTQHPRAEIEDLRAWYLWRSQGGLQYAFDNRPVEDAAALLRSCLRYRKSFCGHLSTDFDLAAALVGYLSTRSDAPSWLPAARQAVTEQLALLRRIDLMPPKVMAGPRGALMSQWTYRQVRAAKGAAAAHQRIFDLPDLPHYEVFNDNRYEQHWWSWSG